MTIGERIAELRKDHGYDQRYIADYLNISRTSVSNYEKGINEPNLSNMIKLADLFNVSLDYLMCRTDQKANPYLMQTDKYLFLDYISSVLNEFQIKKK